MTNLVKGHGREYVCTIQSPEICRCNMMLLDVTSLARVPSHQSKLKTCQSRFERKHFNLKFRPTLRFMSLSPWPPGLAGCSSRSVDHLGRLMCPPWIRMQLRAATCSCLQDPPSYLDGCKEWPFPGQTAIFVHEVVKNIGALSQC